MLPPEGLLWRYGPRRAVADAREAGAAVDALASEGSDLVKFRNLRPDEVRAAGRAARRRGLPLAGHAPAMDPGEAAEAGVTSLEHAETVSLALGGAGEADRSASFARVGRAGAVITPTLANFRIAHLSTPDEVERWLRAEGPSRGRVSSETLDLWRLSRSLQGSGGQAEAGESYKRQVADMRLAAKAGVPLLAGTDLGSVAGQFPGESLHQELAALVAEVGLTPAQALRAATSSTARSLGGRFGTGSVRVGKRADLILLEADPLADVANLRRLRAVVLGGRLLGTRRLARLGEGSCAGPPSR